MKSIFLFSVTKVFPSASLHQITVSTTSLRLSAIRELLPLHHLVLAQHVFTPVAAENAASTSDQERETEKVLQSQIILTLPELLRDLSTNFCRVYQA